MVYVDHFLFGEPSAHHQLFWERLIDKNISGINIDDPEPLDRFLAHKHVVLVSNPKQHQTGWCAAGDTHLRVYG